MTTFPRFHKIGLAVLASGLALLAHTVAEAQNTPAAPNGLYGQFFDNSGNNVDAATPGMTQYNGPITFGTTAAGQTPVPYPASGQNFTVRWTGCLVPTATGQYSFSILGDDGVRLWIDGNLVADGWRFQGTTTYSGTVANLNQNQKYSIRVEFMQGGGPYFCDVQWTPPGAAAASIPATALLRQTPSPKITPVAGALANSSAVTMSCDIPGATISYQLNGGAAQAYANPFAVSANATISAVATAPGLSPSDPTVVAYTLTDTTPPVVNTVIPVRTNQFMVRFNEALTAGTAQTLGNYSTTTNVSPFPVTGAVTAAALQNDLQSVLLTITGLTLNTNYVLNVSGISDAAGNVMPQAQSIVFTDHPPTVTNLTNYWTFDDPRAGTTAGDSAGTNTGTLQALGATSTAGSGPFFEDGVYGGALRFNGLANQVHLAADLAPVMGNGDCSMAVWVRTQSQGTGDGPANSPGILGSNAGNNGTGIAWGFVAPSARPVSLLGIQANGTLGAQTSNATPFNDGNWHHVVFTRAVGSGATQVFMDGVLVTTVNSATGNMSTVIQTIGHLTNEGSNHYFLGELDELRVYSRVVSQAEVYDFVNQPPVVSAGPNQTVPATPPNTVVQLAGTVSDDGLPAPSTLTTTWTLVSASAGAGTVVFSNANSLTPTATFSAPGLYVLRLTASDGALSCSSDCTIDVQRISVTPTTVSVAEKGGTTFFTVTLTSNPGGAVTIPITSTNPGQAKVSSVAFPVPATMVTLTFNPGASLTQTVTITGVDDFILNDPTVVPINVGPSSCPGDATFNGVVLPTVTCNVLEGDTVGIVVTPPSGLSIVNGGPSITFTVQLSTTPTANVQLNLSVSDPNLATVFPTVIPSATQNTPVTITVTPLNVDTQTTYTAPFDIIITTTGSLDPNYLALGATLVPIDTAVHLPPLHHVWKCGLLGLEGILPLGLLALIRRRRRA